MLNGLNQVKGSEQKFKSRIGVNNLNMRTNLRKCKWLETNEATAE